VTDGRPGADSVAILSATLSRAAMMTTGS
jgi:hypothetical protein